MHSGQRRRSSGMIMGIGLGTAFVCAVIICGVRTLAAPVESTATYATGDLDPTFGGGGFPFGFYGPSKSDIITRKQPSDIAVTAEGKIVVAGLVQNYTGSQTMFGAVRYTVGGAKDVVFGASGQVTTSFGNTWSHRVRAMKVQPDAKTVVLGSVNKSPNNGDKWDTALVRYNVNGVLDSTFGSQGKVTLDLSGIGKADDGFDLAVQDNGSIVVAATASGGTLVLARLLSNGALDSSFGTGGRAKPLSSPLSGIPHLAMLPGGKILVATETQPGGAFPNYTTLVQLMPNGTLDGSFAGGGILKHCFQIDLWGGTNLGDDVAEVLVQPDGKIILYGADVGFVESTGWVARLMPNGALDASFNGTAVAGTPVLFWPGAGLAVQGDGKIVASGYGDNTEVLLLRYNKDGTPDSTFGDGGMATAISNPLAPGQILALQPNGRIVTVGGTGYCWVLAGFLPDDPMMALGPDPVAENGILTLAAAPTHGLNGAILAVEFWLDFDGDGALDDAIDVDLGPGENVGGIWGLNVTVTWPPDVYTYFAVATYASGETVDSRQGVVTP